MKTTKTILLSLFILTTADPLTAGVTGKITGIVVNSATGEPLVGVNVLLENTPLGAATDFNGNYTILNVRGGKYTVVASMIGYKTVEVVDVTVLADHTTFVDIELEQTAIEGEEVVITAERPVIVKDETATTSTVLADEIQNMPVNSYQDVMTTVAGVLENHNSNTGIHIRGSRTGEVAYLVDGFLVLDPIFGGTASDVTRSGISELSIVTGAFDAEYGDAMSGVVNILTKEGTDKLSGSVRLATDKFGRLLSKTPPDFDWNSQRVEASIGGPIPIPFLKKDFATFFISGDTYNTNTYLSRSKFPKPILLTDVDGDGVYDEEDGDEYVSDVHDMDIDGDKEEPLVKGFVSKNATFRNETRINAKLVFRPVSGIKITTASILNRVKRKSYSQSYRLVQQNLAPTWDESDLYYVTLSHTLSPKTFYNIKFSRFVTDTRSGLDKYMKNREMWYTEDASKINRYWQSYEPYADLDGNGAYSDGEPFHDVDGDGLWDMGVYDTGRDGIFAESFTDENGNYTWDPGEGFVDANGDGIWTGPDEGELDGQPTPGEEGVMDRWWSFYAEPFVDEPDGLYRAGSADILVYDADEDGVYDAQDGDYFIDIAGDGVWREGEEFTDVDGDGEYNYGATPWFRTAAFEGISNYEFLGGYALYDLNGDSVRWTESEDITYTNSASNTTTLQANFVSQITPVHQLQLGGEIKKHDLSDYQISGYGGGIWGLASDASYVNWQNKPEEQSLYIKDKIEYRDWIVNLSLRWDYVDPKSNFPDPLRSLVWVDENGNFTSGNAGAEVFYDEGNGIWDSGEYFVDANSNGQYDAGEIFTDSGNGIWDWTDTPNGRWDVGESFSDANGNGQYDDGENFTDAPNGFFDSEDDHEYFVDGNGDGLWTGRVAKYGYLDDDGNFVEAPRAEKKWKISPRIGIGFPITDRVAFHFSYAQFFKWREYNLMYRLANMADPNIYQNSLWPFPYSLNDWYIARVGNPNMKPETTVLYELGLRWHLSENFFLKTTLYYKDVYDYVTFVNYYVDPTDYAVLENQDYANSRGIEFNLQKLFSRNFSFSINYTYSQAVGNASNEHSHWYEEYLSSVYGTYPSMKTVTMSWDQPHTLNFTLDYRHPKRYGLNLIGYYGSGLPYTPTDIRGLNLGESNSGRMPSNAYIDFMAYKDFHFKSLAARLFVDVRNALNTRNVYNVFSNSGKPDESLNPNASPAWEDRPQYFGPPRHIELGIEILFKESGDLFSGFLKKNRL